MNAKASNPFGDARYLFLLVSLLFSTALFSQREDKDLTATILFKDSLFWKAYNNCDLTAFRTFFTDDVEFYHDKGGITLGADALTATMKNNLCSNPNFRLRREVVEGSRKVYPLKKNDTIYGAILTGEHLFYINETGKPERLDGHASFTHLWLLKNGEWKMARVLSYDHHAAEYINKRTAIALDENALKQFIGTYKGPQPGDMQVVVENKALVLKKDDAHKYQIYPESKNIFFSKERDLTFEFVKQGTKIEKMVVRENGAVTEELTAVR